MGQREIKEYLNNESLKGYRGFFTLSEVSRAIHSNISNTSRQIKKMLKAGILERNVIGGWKLAIRLNKNHITKPLSDYSENIFLKLNYSPERERIPEIYTKNDKLTTTNTIK